MSRRALESGIENRVYGEIEAGEKIGFDYKKFSADRV
jgi:hypothetical protein